MRKPKRIFEIGFQVDTGVSNNFFKAKDFFVEDVVIDLPQMSEDVPSDGWQIDFLFNNNLYVNAILLKFFRLYHGERVAAFVFGMTCVPFYPNNFDVVNIKQG